MAKSIHFVNNKYNILVIEDNEGDFILIEDYLNEKLTRLKLKQVMTFSMAKLALETNEAYDVILLDLTLPDLRGEELVKELKKISKGIPIIVLTGFIYKDFGIKSLSLGVSDYLQKDEYTPTELYKSIVYSIERNKINLELRASERKYRHIFHSNPLPMWVCDISTNKFLDVNDAAIQHYGYSFEEFMEMKEVDLLLEEQSYKRRSLLFNTKMAEGATLHQLKTGEIIQVNTQSNLVDFAGEQAELVLVIDITEKVKAEQDLLKSKKALHQLNIELENRVLERTQQLSFSNSELEMFNYAVSHELKGPLHFINYSLEAFLRKNNDFENKEVLEGVKDACAKMYQQLVDLLEFSKVGKQAMRPTFFDMNTLYTEVMKSLNIEYDLTKYNIKRMPLLTAFGDKNLIFYVLRNLLSNALKYTSKSKKKEITVSVQKKEKNLVYSVQDTGVGFKMENYDLLFKYFERLHAEGDFPGNGAGLSIAQRVIERHGGEIWAESVPKQGSTFYFSLPNIVDE